MGKNILIVAAMEDVELDYLKQRITKCEKIEYKGFNFYKGKLSCKDVVLCQSNIGLINSAICVTIGIERFNPNIIINEGLAGGYTNSVRKGDIVIAEDAINITSMEYKGSGNSINDYEITTFLHNCCGNRLTYQKADDKLINVIKENFNTDCLHFGRLASGDIWNKNPSRIKYINEKYGAICEDMEGISIYTTANLYGIPAISIKGISNNEVLGEKYEASIGEKVQKFVEEFVLKI